MRHMTLGARMTSFDPIQVDHPATGAVTAPPDAAPANNRARRSPSGGGRNPRNVRPEPAATGPGA